MPIENQFKLGKKSNGKLTKHCRQVFVVSNVLKLGDHNPSRFLKYFFVIPLRIEI